MIERCEGAGRVGAGGQGQNLTAGADFKVTFHVQGADRSTFMKRCRGFTMYWRHSGAVPASGLLVQTVLTFYTTISLYNLLSTIIDIYV